jgi:uncharacterized lipoprotein YmbA
MMAHTSLAGRSLAILVLVALAGCGTSPPPVLYTLAAQPGAVLPMRKGSVELRRVGLAGYLDRPEIVRGTVDFRLQVTDGDRWGEPLGRMLDRILTEDLVQRLPDAAVFAESGAISTRPDIVLEIDIQRLDADPTGAMVLLAQIAVRPEGKPASAQTIRLTAPIAQPGTQAHAAAMSAVVGQLADRIAALLARG